MGLLHELLRCDGTITTDFQPMIGGDPGVSTAKSRASIDVVGIVAYREHGEPDSNTHVHVWLCRDCGMEREPLYGPDF